MSKWSLGVEIHPFPHHYLKSIYVFYELKYALIASLGSFEGLLEAFTVFRQAVLKGCWRFGSNHIGSFEGLLEAKTLKRRQF